MSESAVKDIFVRAYNSLHADRERLKEDYALIIETLRDTTALDKEATKLTDEAAEILEAMRKDMEENARRPIDQGEYNKCRHALATRFDVANKRIADIALEKHKRTVRQESIVRFIAELDGRGVLTEFDEGLGLGTVEHMTAGFGGVVVAFKDGSEVSVDLSGK